MSLSRREFLGGAAAFAALPKFAEAAGHYRLEVSDERVVVVFYADDSTVSTRTFMLAENKKNKVVTHYDRF